MDTTTNRKSFANNAHVAAAASGEEVPVSVPSPETDYPHASGDQELALGSVPAFDSASGIDGSFY